MKNKTRLTFMTVALAALMVLGACNQKEASGSSSSEQPSSISSSESSESSSSSSSSSVAPKNKYLVEFKSEGVTLQSSEVEEGEKPEYEGDMPLKESNSVTNKYRFNGWDKSLDEPITQATVFNATFKEVTYTPEVLIDDFESYNESADLIDEGWTVSVYNNKWTEDTTASISLSGNAKDGQKALRFNSFGNSMDFKATKNYTTGTFNQSVNALQFKIMAPSYSLLKVILVCKVRIAGVWQEPSFSYTLGNPATNDYIDYTIPLADGGWALWQEEGKSIKTVAGWSGVHQDDILKYLSKVEFYSKATDNKKGQAFNIFIDSVKFTTSQTVEAEKSVIEPNITPYAVYTGTLANGHIIRIDINNGNNATAKVIDLEEPVTINGSVSMDGKDVTFTSADNGKTLFYKGKLSNRGQTISFVSATGDYAKEADEMNLNAVVAVDDFEDYQTGGTAFCENSPNAANRTGVYRAYFGEHYTGTGGDEWGGAGWNILPGDGEAIELVDDAISAHSGSKYLKLLNGQENAFRYMQWGLYDGSSDMNYYHGKTLSFWAKTDGYVPSFKASCYYQTSPKNATKEKYVYSETFPLAKAVNEWQHFEVPLEEVFAYYGYLIFIEKNKSADSYLMIDKVEIYGANPYAKYEPPVPEKGPEPVKGLNYTSVYDNKINIDLNIKDNNAVELKARGLGMSVNGTYAVEDKEVTFTFEGGTVYTATISDDIKSLTYKSVSGTDAAADALYNRSFKMYDYADNAETYEEDGMMYYQQSPESARRGARGAYYCDFKHGNVSYTSPVGGSSWILMGGSGDQLQLDKANAYEGTQSLKMKKSNAGDMRYLEWDLFKGTASAKTGFDKFSVALKNVDTATTVKIMVYKVQQVTPETQGDDYAAVRTVTMEANQDWTVYTVDLDPTEKYYGYCMYFLKDSVAAMINVDNAIYYNSSCNPEMLYCSPKGLTLSNGDDYIKFNDNDNILIKCGALSMVDSPAKFEMSIVEGHQYMTIKVADKIIKGTYTATPVNVVFEVTEIDHALEAIYPIGAIFN